MANWNWCPDNDGRPVVGTRGGCQDGLQPTLRGSNGLRTDRSPFDHRELLRHLRQAAGQSPRSEAAPASGHARRTLVVEQPARPPVAQHLQPGYASTHTYGHALLAIDYQHDGPRRGAASRPSHPRFAAQPVATRAPSVRTWPKVVRTATGGAIRSGQSGNAPAKAVPEVDSAIASPTLSYEQRFAKHLRQESGQCLHAGCRVSRSS